jgi:hypothetical protein
MDCDDYGRVHIMVGRDTRVCTAAGQHITFNGYTGYVVCPDPARVCGVVRYDHPPRTPEPGPSQGTPLDSEPPTPAITEPGDGYSFMAFYTQSWVDTYLFLGVTVTEIGTQTYVETFTNVNGVMEWGRSFSDRFVGTISLFSHARSLSMISWLQAIPSQPYEGKFGVNAAGWAGIVISGGALVAFILGVIICSRRADKAWQAEQRKFAQQQAKAGKGRRRA